eukprot:GILI01006153.1.p1 GENE.GILI01006153.1~~GILI01006153.1.p1  ORF type:complete len:239 (-),score=25.01 GILI01006153.1:36-677(-)
MASIQLPDPDPSVLESDVNTPYAAPNTSSVAFEEVSRKQLVESFFTVPLPAWINKIVEDGNLQPVTAWPFYVKNNAASDSLIGPDKIKMFRFFITDNKDYLLGVWQLGPGLCGHPKIVHGGVSAFMFDETFGWMGAANLGRSFTANLNVNYKRPMIVDESGSLFVVFKVYVDRREGRKLFLKASCIDENDNMYSDATCLFLQPREPIKYPGEQ